MRYIGMMLMVVAAVGFIGCDAPSKESVEQGKETLERAGESLKKVGESLKETAAAAVLPPAREEQLGDRMAQQIAAESQLVTGTPVSNYIKELGQEVVAAAQDKPQAIDFDFHVIKDPQINAFAIPGGHIYVTTGLLEAAETEAELIAVLGHEVAHVTERHVAERMTAAYGISTLTSLALGENTGALEQIAIDLLAQGYLLKHSRDNEREADEAGMGYVIEAGYSPTGYVQFFERLAEQPQPPAILSTHPNPEERAQTARKAIEKLDPSVVERDVHRERYQQMTSAL